MTTWVTSDLHFYHKNIMKFCPETRGRFRDVDHMNEEIVRIWNDVVAEDDLVYNLGDVTFGNAYKTATEILQRMNGRQILIKGNHDPKPLKDVHFRNCFEEIHDYLEIKHMGKKIVLFHYPLAEWNSAHYGAIHLYGHVHGSPTGLECFRTMDVGFDATGNVVTNLDTVVEMMKNVPKFKPHHGQTGEE